VLTDGSFVENVILINLKNKQKTIKVESMEKILLYMVIFVVVFYDN